MKKVNEQTESISTTIQQLETRSKEIGTIVSIISNISDQTNLLSLNAAIEAARAGEEGKGFSVVAEEVRKLAVQSSESANQIGVLIGEIQRDIEKSANSIKEGTETVKEGLVSANQAGVEFKDILTSIKEVSSQIQEVSASIKQMNSGIETVSGAINDSLIVSEEAADFSNTVAASIEEQTATMEEIAATSIVLSEMAEQLHRLTKKFVL